MADLGTLLPGAVAAAGQFLSDTGGSPVGTLFDDDPSTGQPGSDYVYTAQDNVNDTGRWEFTNTPSTFASIDTLTFDCYVEESGFSDDQRSCSTRIVDSAGTALTTGSETILSVSSSATNRSQRVQGTFTINATGLAANKATWDGARIEITVTNAKNKGPDAGQVRIHAYRLGGTYTEGALEGTAPLDGSAALSATGQRGRYGAAAFAGSAALSGTGQTDRKGAAALSGSAALSASGSVPGTNPTVEGTYRNHWVGVTNWPQDFNPSFTVLDDDVIYAFLSADDAAAEVGLTLTMADQSGTSGGTWELVEEVRQTTTGRMMQGALWRKVVTNGTNESGVTYRADGGGTEEGSVDMLLVRGASLTGPTFDSFAHTDHSATTINVAGPSTVAEGDLMLAYIVSASDQTALTGTSTGSLDTIPSGWTELLPNTDRSTNADSSSHIFYKIATASDASAAPTTYAWGNANAINGGSFIVRVTNVDPNDPIAGITFTAAATAGSVGMSSITTDVDDCLLIQFLGVDESVGTNAPYWADPPTSGWTADYGTSSTTSSEDGGTNVNLGMAHTTQASAGATGTVTASTASQSDDNLMGVLVAVKSRPEDVDTTSGSEFYSGGRTDSAPTNPAITTATDNALVLLFQNTNGSDLTAITAPSGYTKHTEPATIPTVHVNSSSASKVVATAGTETPGTWTLTGSASFDDSIMFTVAVKAAVTVSPTGSAALSGSGALSATGTPDRKGAAALSGSASLAATGQTSRYGALALSGSGAIAATGSVPSSAPVVESQTFTSINGTSVAVSGPATVAEGDLMICFMTVDWQQSDLAGGTSTSSVETIPSGWTELNAGTARSGSNDCSSHAFYKIATAADASAAPTTYTWGDTNSLVGAAHIIRVSNVDQTTPIDDSTATGVGAASTSIALSAVTTEGADRLLWRWSVSTNQTTNMNRIGLTRPCPAGLPSTARRACRTRRARRTSTPDWPTRRRPARVRRGPSPPLSTSRTTAYPGSWSLSRRV